MTETTDDIALGIRRDVENALHQASADQNVIDERHRIMAEIFTTDTNTQAVDGGDQRLRETVGDCEPDRLDRERTIGC